jgi:hypothetical protein
VRRRGSHFDAKEGQKCERREQQQRHAIERQ